MTLWSHISNKRQLEEDLNTNVNGEIKYLEYGIKGDPTFWVNGVKYNLAGPYNFEHKIDEGDSIVKIAGSTTYKIIKHLSQKEILFRR